MPGKIKYRRGPVCGQENCKSKLYYEEDGFTYCKGGGHLQEGVQTQQNEDDFGKQGRTTSIRKGNQEKIPSMYRGHTATELYLQAYQLILWKQCYTFIHTTGLPAELETVVKDLWALRLQLLKRKADATTDEDAVFSSQPQTETETETRGDDGGREYKIKAKAMPCLIETLALCYLGVVLLRLPIGMGDLHRWAVREDIPFTRAVRLVPIVMKEKLPAEYLKALDTTSPLEPDHLRKAIHNLSLFYTHHFKLVFPRLNVPLLLYKYIRYLALPITLYPITLKLSNLLSVSFTFPTPGSRQRLSSLPELQLISLLTVATKLYHPFDTLPRHVRSLADLATLTIDWPSWVSAQGVFDTLFTSEGHLARGSEINVTEADVLKMTGEQLDEYMDYYERTFIDPERVEQKSRGLPKELLDMFPTGRLDGSEPVRYSYQERMEKEQAAIGEKLKTMVGSLKLRSVVAEDSEEPVHRIGNFYKRYRRVEELEGYAKVFYERAAEAVGVKVETLVLAVGQLERGLIKWREAKVKEGLEEEAVEYGGGGNVQRGEAEGNKDDVEMKDGSDGDNSTTSV